MLRSFHFIQFLVQPQLTLRILNDILAECSTYIEWRAKDIQISHIAGPGATARFYTGVLANSYSSVVKYGQIRYIVRNTSTWALSLNPYIFPKNPLVSLLVYACSAKTVGPRGFIFGMDARCSSPCILHTFPSVYLPHWQWPAPMGSWRVQYTCKAKEISNLFQLALMQLQTNE